MVCKRQEPDEFTGTGHSRTEMTQWGGLGNSNANGPG